MKLLRLKINDPAGFRSLPCGFEHHFRTEWSLQEELSKPESFAPFVCAGPNGSGKSNLLEALAAIFFQLEILRVRRSFLPEVLQDKELDYSPMAFELDYLIQLPKDYVRPDSPTWAKVCLIKRLGGRISFYWKDWDAFNTDIYQDQNVAIVDLLAPQYVLGYSSGENEILSLPFFKMRFVQFDEYWNALSQQLPYAGRPDTRLAFLDSGFSQAILLCNLLFQDYETLLPFREDVGVEALKEFRVIIRRSIVLDEFEANRFAQPVERSNFSSLQEFLIFQPALSYDDDTGHYRLNVLKLLEGEEKSSSVINALKRCATLSYHDESSDCLILDYWIDKATKDAFRNNFDNSPLALFQAFQVLLTLNLYSVSDALKADLYRSSSHYVSETVPILAADQRIMRFKHVKFTKRGIKQPIQLKDLSDGEHQLLHSLGLCLLFRDTNSLFLLDEPETHFNPDWRANFISRLRQCLSGSGNTSQEMLITTHTPFLISDSRPEKVLVFNKDKTTGEVSISLPDYNTLGASINKITMETFHKQETIGLHANQILRDLLDDPAAQNDPHALAKRIMETIGDSIERTFAVQSVLANSGQPKFRDESD